MYSVPILALIAAVTLFSPVSVGAELSEKTIEAWLNDEIEDLPTASINEGKLRFLTNPPKKKVHHHHNTFIIHDKSLEHGWIKILQCHENLDPFPRAQVVYNKNKIKNLKIIRALNIKKAWIENATVQLRNVGKNAYLCIQADSRALTKNADGSFTLTNGPFMRRFLDGFFPMRVSMDLKLPRKLKFISINPRQQQGFRVNKTRQGIHFDAWFEGKLYTRIKLKLIE